MKIKIKKLRKDAVIPSYAIPGDAGMDLTAVSRTFDKDGNIVYGTGIAVEIPDGYVGFVFPRSSNARTNMYLTNSVGVIDSGYRGEIRLKFKCVTQTWNPLKVWWKNYVRKNFKDSIDVDNRVQNGYDVGERIGQLIIMPYPFVEFLEADELSETERGAGGYGSSGN